MSRILIVDDEPAVLQTLATLLIDEGYQVQAVATSFLAIEMIVHEPPDLLVTDVMMPGLDGWTLLDRARASVPNLPVTVISAVDRMEATRRDLLIADHTVFLRKPFDLETLLTTVQRLIGSPRN